MQQIFRKFLLFTLIMVGVSLLSGCQKDNTDQYENIIKRGNIIVGIDDTFVPMGFRDEEDNLTGFDIDLARMVFKEMGLEVKFQRIDWSMKETELNNKTIDVIWNGYTITDQRKEKVTFSDPYLENRQVIVVLKSSSIRTKADLENKVVGVQSASSSLDALNNDKVTTDNIKEIVQLDTNNLIFTELVNKQIDAMIIDEVFANYYIKLKNLDCIVLEEDFGTEQYGVGFRKSDQILVEEFNEIFNQLKEDDSTADTSKKWFNKDIIIK